MQMCRDKLVICSLRDWEPALTKVSEAAEEWFHDRPGLQRGTRLARYYCSNKPVGCSQMCTDLRFMQDLANEIVAEKGGGTSRNPASTGTIATKK